MYKRQVVLIALGAFAFRNRRSGEGGIGADARLLLWVCAAWILAPTAVLVGWSLVVRPVYQPHYLAFTTPALALLLGLCVVLVGRDRRRIGVILLVIAAAAVPNYVAQRGLYAKYGSDYTQVADLFAARAQDGDCLDVDATMSPSVPDAIEGVRIAHGDGLRDVARDPAVPPDRLFRDARPATDRADDLRACLALWTVTDFDRDAPAEVGFCAVDRWQFNQTQVVRAVRC